MHTILRSRTGVEVAIGPDQPFAIIGERINPTGRKALAAELLAGNFERVKADGAAFASAFARNTELHATRESLLAQKRFRRRGQGTNMEIDRTGRDDQQQQSGDGSRAGRHRPDITGNVGVMSLKPVHWLILAFLACGRFRRRLSACVAASKA